MSHEALDTRGYMIVWFFVLFRLSIAGNTVGIEVPDNDRRWVGLGACRYADKSLAVSPKLVDE
jgi:hypothetical protein